MNQILIATPVLGASPLCADVAFGYAEARARLATMHPIELLPASVGFSMDVVRACNRIAGHVLREMPTVTHVLWWDSDNWPEDVRVLQAMIDTGADVIGAPYVRKRKPSRWVHRFLREEARVTTLRGHAVMEVAGVGLGFTLTSRAALERVSFAARHYTDAPRSDVIADIFGLLYEPTVEDSTWTAARGDETDILLSQDFSFARRWRLLGGKVYVYAAAGNSIAHAGMYPWTSKDIEGGTE